jgi:hypothetical protein
VVEPVSATFTIGMKAATKWAADLLWDRTKDGAVMGCTNIAEGSAGSLCALHARQTSLRWPVIPIVFNRIADFAAQGTANDD